jgi:lysylphosphatidylglycerol synthetase-like protein (DUF2156 family)
LAACVPVILAIGLLTRFGLSGGVADASGSVFYTALVYVLLALIAPRARPIALGLGALAFSVAIELFQLTSVPAKLADGFSPIKLVLGTSFAASDLAAYAVGAASAVAIEHLASSRARSPSDTYRVP